MKSFALRLKKKIDGFERDIARRKIHEFWFRREIPTLDEILLAVNKNPGLQTFKRSSLHLLIRDLNFEYVRCDRNSAVVEMDVDDIVLWRTKYIGAVRKYRPQERPDILPGRNSG